MADLRTTTLYLRDLIKSTLNTGASVEYYPDEAPEGASYPYGVFEVTDSNAEDFPRVGFLEVNIWDYYSTWSRVDSILDKLEITLYNQYFNDEHVAFRCFKGERQHVSDEDKNVKRVREKFLIRYNKKGE